MSLADENYRPTPPADPHAVPMEGNRLLEEDEFDSENSADMNALQSVTTDRDKPVPYTTIAKVTDQPVLQSSSQKSKNLSKIADKLYTVGQTKKLEFYQALLSEFIGTMLLTLICTGTGLSITSRPVPDLNGALVAGLIVATIIVGFGHVSGAHINPAVTVAFLVSLDIDFLRALCFIGMQLLGAITASSLVRGLTPLHAQDHLGMTMIAPGISLTQAFIVEFIITFILCYTVRAICDPHRDDIGGSKALAVGFAVTIGCLFGGPYTGASMNPARSFGPAVVMNSWTNHWIYWLGPLAGSITASLLYTRVFKIPALSTVRSGSHASVNKSNR